MAEKSLTTASPFKTTLSIHCSLANILKNTLKCAQFPFESLRNHTASIVILQILYEIKSSINDNSYLVTVLTQTDSRTFVNCHFLLNCSQLHTSEFFFLLWKTFITCDSSGHKGWLKTFLSAARRRQFKKRPPSRQLYLRSIYNCYECWWDLGASEER